MKIFEQITATDHGLAVRGGTCRGVAAVQDGSGKDAAVVWLMDDYNYRLLQIDVETGACDTIFVPFEKPDAVYSSLRSSKGKCYSLFGNHFAAYDPQRKEFTFTRRVPSLAAMAMEEDESGIIWAVTYPDCALYAFDPAAQVFTDHGVLKEESWQQYPRSLVAASDNWLYIGLGMTAGNIIAYNKMTREIRHLFTESERCRPAMYSVYKGKNGNIYALHEKTDHCWRLENGTKTPCPRNETQLYYHSYSGDQNVKITDFPSGRTLIACDPPQGIMEILEKDGVTRRTVSFSFENSGAPMMALDVNSSGIVAGGGFFPFYFGKFDPATGEKSDEYANVQCNTILAYGSHFYIGGYGGGQLMRYDASQPWTLKTPMLLTEPDLSGNPLFYGKANPVINRPHCLAITPDGKTLAMGGTPEYGMTGGGIALLDTDSGQFRIIPHTELAENESPFAMAAISNSLLLIGTTIAPGTGGEVKAENASLLLMELPSGKILWRSKELGATQVVIALLALPDGNVIGIDGENRLFRFETASRKIITGESLKVGDLAVTQGSRLLLRDGEDIWLLFKQGVGKVEPVSLTLSSFLPVTPEIRTGGALRNGILYYSGNYRWCSVPLDYRK